MSEVVRRPPRPTLDEGSKSYYKRVESYLDGENGEEVDGDSDVFLCNVIDQVISDGLRLVSCDKDGSRTLERLLQHPSMNTDLIKNLMKSATPVFFKLCLNRCGSHVMEALIHLTGHTLSKNRNDDELLEYFLSWMSIIEDKISDYIQHPYASHVLGGAVQDLSGVQLAEEIGRSRYSQEFRMAKMGGVSSKKRTTMKVVPEVFITRLNSMARKISRLGNLRDMLTHQSGCPVLQSLVGVLALRLPERNTKITKKLIKLSKVLREEEEASLPVMFTDLVSSHLIEVMVENASHDLQLLIFNTCLKGRVMMAALHPIANFPLQHLIGSANPQLLKDIVIEVSSIEEVLFVGHTGMVVKLLETAAVCCPDVQPSLVDALLKAFHVDTHLNFIVPVIMALVTYEIFHEGTSHPITSHPHEGEVEGNGTPHPITSHPHEGEVEGNDTSQPITLHGSLLVQALLKFQDTKLVVRSMVRMSGGNLAKVGCDSNGSHVLTTFMTSTTVPAKKKEKIMTKLEDNFLLLCTNKYGSRVVDVLWRLSEVKKKEELAKILLANEEGLSSDFHGSIVLRNCNITHFKKKQGGWLETQRAASKRQELFQDILGGEGQSTTGNRSKKRKLSSDLSHDKTKTKNIKTSLV